MQARARRERSGGAGEEPERQVRAERLGGPADVRRLQRAAGNQAVARLIREHAARAGVNRLVGFEVELSVPTYLAAPLAPHRGKGGEAATLVADFLGGGI